MWKPGTSPPSSGTKQSSASSSKKSSNKSASSLQMAGTPTASLTPTKKLSGATMNMRFMKRKQETQQQQEQQRKERLSIDHESNSVPVRSTPAAGAAVSTTPLPPLPTTTTTTPTTRPLDHNDGNDHMEIDTPVALTVSYQEATPIDMYGMKAALIGRRSFGGFNAAMEEAWKESKASLEHDSPRSKQPKVSDEELLQRYEEIVKKRSDSRPVGNLREKSKTKRQRR